MEITTQKVKLNTLKLNPDNPRRISTKDMDRLVKSINEFPDMMQLREIVVDESMTVLGGNMRLLAMRKIGAKEVTAKIVKGLTPEQKREFIIKDNGSWGEWDMDLLSAWDDLPLIDWGVKLPEGWMDQSKMDVLDSDGSVMSGSNYGDARSDKVPLNILGIGGMVDRSLMERAKEKLLGMGAKQDCDNGEKLSNIFMVWMQ